MAKQNTSHIDSPAALGQRLRATRLARGLTQSALVFDGCTIGHVSRIEAGLRTPSLQVVRRLAATLGVDEQWLATGTAAPPEPKEETLLRDAAIAIGLGEAGEARAALERLAARDDGQVSVRSRLEAALGRLALVEGRPHEALGHLQLAFEDGVPPADADAAEAAEALARAYHRLDRLPEAIALVRERLALAEAENDAAERLRFGVLLAETQLQQHDRPAAAETLARIGDAIGEPDPVALARDAWMRSRLRADKGDTRGAVDQSRRALAILEAGACEAFRARARQLLAGAALPSGEAGDPDVPPRRHESSGLSALLGRAGDAEPDAALQASADA